MVLSPDTFAQFNYAIKLFKPVLDGDLDSVGPTTEATTLYNNWLAARLSSSVWVQCTSWYRSGGAGKIFSTFPGTAALFWWLTLTPRCADYDIRGKDREKWASKQHPSNPLRRTVVSLCGLSGLLLMVLLVGMSVLKLAPANISFPGLLERLLKWS